MSLISDRIKTASKEWWNTPRGLTLNRTELDWRAAMQSTETWKPVTGYEGAYEVSDLGNVRTCAGEIITQTKSKYWRVWLAPETGRGKGAAVHSLVLTAFVGPRPAGQVGRHLDDNKDDNRLVNLAWGTVGDNNRDTVRNGHHPEANKTHCPRGHAYGGGNLYFTPKGHRKCRECDAIRQREARLAGTHCVNGHAFDAVGPKGRRVCLACRAMRAALRAAGGVR